MSGVARPAPPHVSLVPPPPARPVLALVVLLCGTGLPFLLPEGTHPVLLSLYVVALMGFGVVAQRKTGAESLAYAAAAGCWLVLYHALPPEGAPAAPVADRSVMQTVLVALWLSRWAPAAWKSAQGSPPVSLRRFGAAAVVHSALLHLLTGELWRLDHEGRAWSALSLVVVLALAAFVLRRRHPEGGAHTPLFFAAHIMALFFLTSLVQSFTAAREGVTVVRGAYASLVLSAGVLKRSRPIVASGLVALALTGGRFLFYDTHDAPHLVRGLIFGGMVLATLALYVWLRPLWRKTADRVE